MVNARFMSFVTPIVGRNDNMELVVKSTGAGVATESKALVWIHLAGDGFTKRFGI